MYYNYICIIDNYFIDKVSLCSFGNRSGTSSCRPNWPLIHSDPLASAF